jgi:hypothetical protein
MSEILAATLVTIEIYLAHLVGKDAIEACADALAVPDGLEGFSVRAAWMSGEGGLSAGRPGSAG